MLPNNVKEKREKKTSVGTVAQRQGSKVVESGGMGGKGSVGRLS
jgi:hypothetical protein